MRYLSTNDPYLRASLREAVLQGMPADGGLYMPEMLPSLEDAFIHSLSKTSFQEVARHMAGKFMGEDIPANTLDEIIHSSMDLDVKLYPLTDQLSVLETFHGPTMAFKDFGARFMARVMSHLIQGEDRELTILVATSGDTGSAVASGFLGVPGIKVVILYPSGKVSPSQEKQLTTQGQNITALEVDGSFDDCQRMVKAAFADHSLRDQLLMSSANSINIARLIPQSFYYTWAYGQVANSDNIVDVCVPCGNFGNITAALIAQKMGLPISHFIAATNANAVFPDYLESGDLESRPSLHTMSNAMDVGNPSNLARIKYLFENDVDAIRSAFSSWSFSDEQTADMIRRTHAEYGYVIDPHTAVGLLGMENYRQGIDDQNWQGIVVSTAHPAKFPEQVEPILGQKIDIPPQLAQYLDRTKVAIPMSTTYEEFKSYLIDNLV